MPTGLTLMIDYAWSVKITLCNENKFVQQIYNIVLEQLVLYNIVLCEIQKMENKENWSLLVKLFKETLLALATCG